MARLRTRSARTPRLVNAAHDEIQGCCGHRNRLRVLERLARELLQGLHEPAASWALRDMDTHDEMLGCVERASCEAGQKSFRRMMGDRHDSSSKSSLRRFIANLMRDLTVPSGIPSR